MCQCSINNKVQIWLIFSSLFIMGCQADILVFSATSRHQIVGAYRDLPAQFGEPIPMEGIKGMLVRADPPNACKPILPPPNDQPGYDGNWIVLIARNNCTFEEKVRIAQIAQYDAVIVHNVNSDELEPMSAKDSIGITIPSVFVSEHTGKILEENFLYDTLYFILINDDVPYNINTHLLLPFAIVVGICFLVMVIFMVVRCIKDRRRQRRHRLPNSSLKKIPTHKYTKGDPYETCAICLDDYVEGEKLRVLPCAHAYHSKCIDPWLTKNRRVCPVCKRKVFAADEQLISDESDSDADDSTPLIRHSIHDFGTQGGTFVEQSENPFNRASRHNRQDSHSSNSSWDSEQPTTDEGEFISTGEPSNGNVFVVSDTHSINGLTMEGGMLESDNSTQQI